MKRFLIVAAVLAFASQADATCSCSSCDCGPLCKTAQAFREHKPVRRIVAGTLRGAARIVAAPFKCLRGCE